MKTSSPLILDELFLPETRAELQQRLRHQFQQEASARPKRRAGFDVGPSSGSMKTISLIISPLRRGDVPLIDQTTSLRISTPASTTFPQSLTWFERLQDPATVRQLWRNPKVRKGVCLTLASGAVLLCLLLLAANWDGSSVSQAPADVADIKEPKNAAILPSPVESEQTPKAQSAVEKLVATSRVTISVPSPNRVRIEVDDSVHHNTNQVTLPLAPGTHRLQVSKAGYQTVERTFEALAVANQELPAVTLEAISKPQLPKATEAPTAVQSVPEQPMVLPREPFPSDLSPRFTTAEEYGITLTESEERTLRSAIDTILGSDWEGSPKTAVEHARRHRAATARFAKWDPRLDHAYGLLLWHHGELDQAKEAMTEAVRREQNRPGQRVPYYPLYRDKIRLRSVTDEEAKAAEDLLDLARDTERTLQSDPDAGFHEAKQNADFIGRMLGFLEGPSRAKLAHEVNLRLLSSQIEDSFPTSELQEAYKSARREVRAQYEQELAQVEAQQKARAEKERALQQSGELGRTNIRARNNRFNGKREYTAYNNLPLTPVRASAGADVFLTDKGPVGFFTGASVESVPNSLDIVGPEISRSYFNNRTNNTLRDKRKVDPEELPNISWRRPQSLLTYMPQELERKRRQIQESVNASEIEAK